MNYLSEAVVGFMYWQDDICKVKLGEKEILKLTAEGTSHSFDSSLFLFF